MRLNVAVVGRGQWLIHSAQKIHKNHTISAVFSFDGDEHYALNKEDYKAVAQKFGAYWSHQVFDQNKIANILETNDVDIVISSNLPLIVPTTLLELPKYGWLNAHPGPLPRYRGNACPNWAILLGEKNYGIVVHAMTVGLDEGPVFARYEFDLKAEDDIGYVYEIMYEKFPTLFEEAMEKIISGALGESQDNSTASICYPRKESDSLIDWKNSVENVSRLVRSYSRPFRGAYSFLNGSKIRIFRVKEYENLSIIHAVPGQIIVDRDNILVSCGDGLVQLLDYSPQISFSRRDRFECKQ